MVELAFAGGVWGGVHDGFVYVWIGLFCSVRHSLDFGPSYYYVCVFLRPYSSFIHSLILSFADFLWIFRFSSSKRCIYISLSIYQCFLVSEGYVTQPARIEVDSKKTRWGNPMIDLFQHSMHRRHSRPYPNAPHALHSRSPPRFRLNRLFRIWRDLTRSPLRPSPRRLISRHRGDSRHCPDARGGRP